MTVLHARNPQTVKEWLCRIGMSRVATIRLL